MRKRSAVLLLIGLFILSFNATPEVAGYSGFPYPGSTVTWRIDVAPTDITIMYYSEGGNMRAQDGSLMRCEVSSYANDVSGMFAVGNVTVFANDTEIARDLVLGVWGTPTEWWPGLFIEPGQSSANSQNETAYAAAERVAGNYLNGTMTSRYDSVSVEIWNRTSQAYDIVEEECIIFDYEQDPPAFGEPQITHLAYSLNSGVLVKANTSYSFGIPYNLVLSLQEILPPQPVDFNPDLRIMITMVGLIGGGFLAIVVVVILKSRK
ncbi:MAG: hypothetical protein ACFFEK_03370 [Candidatus Thorarchaeota archaeon]